MDKKAPSVEQILNKKAAYESFYAALHTQQKDIDDYYELVFDPEVPSRYKKRMPSTARDWVDAGVRHFTLDNPRAIVWPRRPSEDARIQAALLEKLDNFILRQNIAEIKNGAKKVLIRGEGYFKMNMDDRYIGQYEGKPVAQLPDEEKKEYEEKRLNHFPLFITSPDPYNVYPSPAQAGFVPRDVIEKFNITVAEAKSLCEANGWTAWSTTKQDTETVEWVSYIDSDWRFFSIEAVPVLKPAVQPNIFRFVPYVHFGGGMGQSSYEGKPEYLYRPLLYPKKDALKMESKMYSWIDAMNDRYSWLRYVLRGNPELIKQYYPDHKFPTDPDELLIELPDEQLEIHVLEGNNPPQGLFQELAMLQAQAAPPAVLSGVRQSGVYSGTYNQDLMASGKSIYKDPFKNMEGALGVLMGMGARILETVYNFPVQIKNFSSVDSKLYTEVKPTDIKGHYDCEVKLLAEPPEATDARRALGSTLRTKGSISLKTELMQYHDMSESEAEAEIAQIHAEMALQEPTVRAVMGKSAMLQLGMTEELEALNQAEQAAAQQGGKVTGLARPIPPRQEGESVTTGEELLTKQGRSPEEMSLVPSVREQQEAA
jgi:hypothetical protein